MIAALLLALQTVSPLTRLDAETIPQPASSAPPSEIIGGQVGAQVRYAREDHTHPRITRAGTVVTDAGGNWSITWATSLTAIPVVVTIPVDAGSQPVMCSVSTRTMAGATGKCFRSQLLPSTITLLTALVNYNVLGGAASGVSVQILAIPPTQ